MRIEKAGFFGCVVLSMGILSCTDRTVPQPLIHDDEKVQAGESSIKAGSQEGIQGKKPSGTGVKDKMHGTCMVMAPPLGAEKLLAPCDKMALQLIYQKNKQMIISIIRTQV